MAFSVSVTSDVTESGVELRDDTGSKQTKQEVNEHTGNGTENGRLVAVFRFNWFGLEWVVKTVMSCGLCTNQVVSVCL